MSEILPMLHVPQTTGAQMMPKRDQTLRSPAVTFSLAPGDPEFATLDSEPMPDQLTATNGAVCLSADSSKPRRCMGLILPVLQIMGRNGIIVSLPVPRVPRPAAKRYLVVHRMQHRGPCCAAQLSSCETAMTTRCWHRVSRSVWCYSERKARQPQGRCRPSKQRKQARRCRLRPTTAAACTGTRSGSSKGLVRHDA